MTPEEIIVMRRDYERLLAAARAWQAAREQFHEHTVSDDWSPQVHARLSNEYAERE